MSFFLFPHFLQLYIKLRCDDQPMSEHVEQLLGDLGGELEGEEEDTFLDEDYEPCSDEEEDAAEAPMEHWPQPPLLLFCHFRLLPSSEML